MVNVRRVASTIALKAYSSYIPGPIDLILGRKHQGVGGGGGGGGGGDL